MSVLITGAKGAIGSACVEAFVRRGIHVLAQDLDASSLEGQDGITAISGNLLDPSTLQTIRDLSKSTGLTAVVAAHGIAGSAALPDCSDDFIDRVLNVNWKTIPVLYDVVESALTAAGGTYIAIASQAALGGESENTVYCAAKFAVNGWIKAQNALSPNVSLHSVCPGSTNSALLMRAQKQFATASGLTPEEYYIKRAEQISLGRYGEPREIAAACFYLTQPGKRPTVLPVTGGDVLL